MKKPIMLMILDGWGYNPNKEDNAIYSAKTPNLDRLINDYPNTFIKCSGLDVGLPKGFMGNSEVGHLNIGAGRVVYQDLTRIDKAIEDGEFFNNENILNAFEKAKKNKSKLHLLGLLSDGGVHSHINHVEALISLSNKLNFKDLVVHPFFDGRDTAPKIGSRFLKELFGFFTKYNNGRIGCLSGRYFAMDRDNRWDRVEKAYNAMTIGVPFSEEDPIEYLKKSHANNIGDEFIEPACFDKNSLISDGDVVIFYNFRADRAREITNSLTLETFSGFERRSKPKISYYLCMTEYDEKFKLPVAFPKQNLNNIFGEVISSNGLRQLRIAETEKYAHVTFFFNGGREEPFSGEDRALIDSPRDVATYDLKPEMSAIEVTNRLIKEIDKDVYDFIVVNYANCDMVGHTGIFEAAVKAIETVDSCVGVITKKIIEKGGTVFLTADHGNAEKMKELNSPHTAHTTNDVRFVVINPGKTTKINLREGKLADIMPTILDYMGLNIPKEVTGKTLIIS
ncbi:MAG: 2,3-bisphosphoglycerate-independent phosphoglycerate mutase [bacterium]